MKVRKVGRMNISLIFTLVVLLIFCNLIQTQAFDITQDPYTFGGKVGIGTTPPTARLDVDSADSIAGDFAVTRSANQSLNSFKAIYTDNVAGATTGGQGLWIQANHNTGASFSSYWASITGATYLVNLKGSNTMNTVGTTVQANSLVFTSPGNYSFTDATANSSNVGTTGADSGIRTITNLSAYRGGISLENSSGTWNVLNASIFYASAMVPHSYGTIANTDGVIVEKQSIGTNNMGIWLKGDGKGADIVLGTNKETKLYGNAGNFIVDTAGNVGIGTTSPQALLHVAGNIQVDGNINAKYQDLAEYVRTSESLTKGMVVMIDTKKFNQVVPSDKAYNTLVAGVVSEAPGIILGEGGADKAIIAHTGKGQS